MFLALNNRYFKLHWVYVAIEFLLLLDSVLYSEITISKSNNTVPKYRCQN